MALKYELEQWGAAVEAYDAEDFDKALEIFETIADSAKFHFNMGLIYATLGEHEEACRQYKKAVKLDQFFAVAYFQKGVSHFLLGEFEKALGNFNDSLLYLRKNMLIDYEQLGLKFRLYSCEILFNRGLCYLYLGKTEQGMGDFTSSQKEKQTEEHDVIDEAISVQGQGFTVFSIPVGVIYRPPEGKLKNVKTKDYLGKAKLVAAVDPEDAFTGFSGAQQQKKQQQNTTTPITKANTEGAVMQFESSQSRPESPEPSRPRSLSTNAREPPFPTKAVRNSSKRRPPVIEGSPTLPYADDKISNGFIPGRRSPAPDDNGRSSLNPPGRLNSLRTPNRGPPLRDGPMRSNSLRDPPNRSNSLRNGPPRMNSLRGRGNARAMPQRSNTQGRAQFLQQQMSKMSVSDDDQGYNDYFQNNDQYSNNNLVSPPLSNEDYSQVYDFKLGGDPYYNGDNAYNSPNNGNNNSNRNPGPPLSPARSPSLRGRGASSPGRAMGFKPSPLSSQGGLITPPMADNGEENYASLIFDEDGYGYGDDDETKFEMLPPPQKHMSTQSSFNNNSGPLQKPTKIKIKCYHKDTRVVLVSANIKYPDLIKRIQEKFAIGASLQLKYKDEDGTLVTMIDQDDLEMAISMVPDAPTETGRMEIWIEME